MCSLCESCQCHVTGYTGCSKRLIMVHPLGCQTACDLLQSATWCAADLIMKVQYISEECTGVIVLMTLPSLLFEAVFVCNFCMAAAHLVVYSRLYEQPSAPSTLSASGTHVSTLFASMQAFSCTTVVQQSQIQVDVPVSCPENATVWTFRSWSLPLGC